MGTYIGGYWDADYFDPDYWDCGTLVGGGGEDVGARIHAQRLAEARRRKKIIEHNNAAIIASIIAFIASRR